MSFLLKGMLNISRPVWYKPADNLAPLVRNDLLAKVDKASFDAILNGVSAKMTTDELTKLNAEFVFAKKDIPTIATEWITANGPF